jgi:hypothetical protein
MQFPLTGSGGCVTRGLSLVSETMLRGSVLHGYDYVGPHFSDACWRRMDTGMAFPYPPKPVQQAPWVSEPRVAATALAGIAWLTLVLGQRWQLRTKAVAALPGLATLVVALVGAVAIGDASPRDDDFLAGWLLLGIEGSAVVALFAIVAWQLEVSGHVVLRLVVVLWGTTAFGFIHVFAEYVAMIIFIGAAWAEHGSRTRLLPAPDT